MLIKNFDDVKYGDFVVTKMSEVEVFMWMETVTKRQSYGVFRIDRRKTGFVGDEERPIDAHKIRLTPVGKTNYTERDWYVRDLFVTPYDPVADSMYIFDNYVEALNWATSMNNVKEVN